MEDVFQWSGIAGLYARLPGVNGAVILMYHSVAAAPEAEWIDPRHHVPAGHFAEHVRFLARRRRVVPLADVVEAIGRGQTPAAGTVAITFDDGYLDNLRVAGPLLRELGLPWTLFLPTAYVGRAANQCADELYAAFRTRTCEAFEWAGELFGLCDERECRRAYRLCEAALARAGAHERAALLEQVRQRLEPSGRPPRLTMNWDELRELRALCPGLELGVHTREHLDLAAHAPAARAELAGAADEVERETGVRPRFVAFPYNRTTAGLGRLARELGFRGAMGDGAGTSVTDAADPFALSRRTAPRELKRLDFLTSGAQAAFATNRGAAPLAGDRR